MRYLKYQTTHDVLIGPFIKSTDGYSPLTGLTTGTVDIVYFGGTGNTSGSFSTVNDDFTEEASGYYSLGIGTGMTANIGPLRICYTASSGLPSWDDFTVVNPNVYESLFSATGDDFLYIDVQQVGGSSAEISSGMFSVDVEQVVGTTLGGSTDLKDNLTTASNMNIGAVAGTTVAGTTAFQSTFSTAASINVGSIAGEVVTTDAADNWDNFWFNNDAVSTERVSELPTTADLLTTASNVNVGAVAGTTVAGTTDLKDNLSTASSLNIGAVAGTTLGGSTDLKDNLTTASNMNIGAVAGTTVAGTTAFMNSTSDSINANITNMAGETVTTDAADNWDNFWFNNDVVSTERVSDLPTTADLLTTSDQMEANMIAISSQSLTTQTGANFENFFQDGGAVSTEVLGDMVTTADLFTTASQVDVGRIAGSTVSTSDPQIGVNVIEFASGSATGMVVGTGTIYDNAMDHGTLMKYMQAYIVGDFKVTGASSNQIVYDDESGSTFFSHTITTAIRTWSSD